MVQLKKLLFEGRSQKINKEQLLNYLSLNSFGINSDSTLIGRWVSGFDANFGIVRPKQAEKRRKTQMDENYYNLILDNSKRWSEYPERGKSVIGRTTTFTGQSYHLVIPKIGSRVGISPASDIWYGFQIDVPDFHKVLKHVSHYAEDSVNIPDENFAEFKETINRIDSKIKTDKNKSYKELLYKISTERRRKFIRDFIDSDYTDLFSFIDYYLGPEQNGFEVKKYSEDFEAKDDKEVWTDGPCLLIKSSDRVFYELMGDDFEKFRSIFR